MFRNFFGTGSGSGRGNDFVGQYVELGQHKLRIRRVLGEGGYGFVFAAQDTSSGKEYALKRLMAPDDAVKQQILQEVNLLKKLKGHQNIIKFVQAASSNEPMSHGMTEFLILTELCSGQLVDLLQERLPNPLPFDEMLKVFAQTCMAVSHMHKQQQPIIHRDLKIENLLFNTKGMIKLCDFGSATTKSLHPDSDWTALQRSLAEDEIQKNTTPMYRAPEMVDLYSNHPVTTKADVWALGCILYYLCYMEHPFADSAKLKILNAKYTTPEDPRKVSDLQPLIDTMLQVNPAERPSVDDVLFQLESVAESRGIGLNTPVLASKTAGNDGASDIATTSVMASSGNAMGGNAIFGNVMKGAGSLFNNIKDVSSKVVQSVAGYVRNDLDMSYITQKIIVMSLPAEGIESTYKNSIDDVRTYFDSKYPDHYVVINISQRQYNVSKLNDRVFESGWNPRKAPTLRQLVSLCRKVYNFLRQDKSNVVAIHCLDGKASSAVFVAALLVFCKLFKKPSMALDMFSLRRCQPGQRIDLNPSQRRYLEYVCQLIWEPQYIPHKRPLFLKTVSLSPVPLFNKARTGCRPFVDIYQGEQRILSTALEIEQMREYLISDRRIDFNVNTKLHGDVTIAVFHARSTFGGKVQGKFTSFNVMNLQFHTGFIESSGTSLKFSRNELDLVDADDQKYPTNFNVALDVVVGAESQTMQNYTEPWDKLTLDKLSPQPCFASKEEYWDCREEFGLSEEFSEMEKEAIHASKVNSDSDNEKKIGRSTFFDSLQWNEENAAGPKNQNGGIANNSKGGMMTFSSELESASNKIEESVSSDSESSQQSMEEKESVRTTNMATLIDFGFGSEETNSADQVQPKSDSKSKELFSDSFADEFANLRVSSNAKTEDGDGGGSQSIFNDDFSALKVETDLDSINNDNSKRSFTKKQQDPFAQNSNPLLVNFDTADTLTSDKNVPKSPSTPNFSSPTFGDTLIDTSEPISNIKTNRSPSLKKNKSSSDLLDKHVDDDFFQALGDRNPSTSSSKKEPEDVFSIRSNNIIDPFSVSGEGFPEFNAFTSTTSNQMKHSSSDGDLLGDWGSSHTEPSLKPTSLASNNNSNIHRSASSAANIGNTRPKNDDPFKDFANLSSGNFQNDPRKSPSFGSNQQKTSSTPFGSSGSFSDIRTPQYQQTGPAFQSTAPKRPTPAQSAPNYFVGSSISGQSVFGNQQGGKGGLGGSWGQRPATKNEFSDILGAHGFKPSSEAQKETLKQLKNQAVAEEDDPIKAKIREWADGKERNIRALICSLDSVLWESESRWKPVGMHQLLQPSDVKKYYKRACLSVHPDKLTGTPEEHLARAIFVELNEAWNLFEQSGAKALY